MPISLAKASCNKGNSSYMLITFALRWWSNIETSSQRGCEISVLGDTRNSEGQDPFEALQEAFCDRSWPWFQQRVRPDSLADNFVL